MPSPYSHPAGTVGSQGQDLSPWFQGWQLRQQQAQEQARAQRESQQFAREMAFRETAQKSGDELGKLQLKQREREATSASERDVWKTQLGERQSTLARADQLGRDKVQLEVKNRDYAAGRADREAEVKHWTTERDDAMDNRDYARARQAEAKIEAAKAKQKIEDDKLAASNATADAVGLWQHSLDMAKQQPGGNSLDQLDAAYRNARALAAQKYRDNPAALDAANEAIDKEFARATGTDIGSYGRGTTEADKAKLEAERTADKLKETKQLDEAERQIDYKEADADWGDIKEDIERDITWARDDRRAASSATDTKLVEALSEKIAALEDALKEHVTKKPNRDDYYGDKWEAAKAAKDKIAAPAAPDPSGALGRGLRGGAGPAPAPMPMPGGAGPAPAPLPMPMPAQPRTVPLPAPVPDMTDGMALGPMPNRPNLRPLIPEREAADKWGQPGSSGVRAIPPAGEGVGKTAWGKAEPTDYESASREFTPVDHENAGFTADWMAEHGPSERAAAGVPGAKFLYDEWVAAGRKGKPSDMLPGNAKKKAALDTKGPPLGGWVDGIVEGLLDSLGR